MQPDYEHNYPLLMNAQDKNAFRFGVIVLNTEAFNDATKTASECFLTWDILNDTMPFLEEPVIYVDIQWTKNDLKQKVEELGLQKQQIVILINPSELKVIPEYSAVLGYPSAISSLLDPTCVVTHVTLSSVQKVGHGFLSGCSSLKEVDLSALTNVQKVGDGFLCVEDSDRFLSESSVTRVILPVSPPLCLRLAVLNFPASFQKVLK